MRTVQRVFGGRKRRKNDFIFHEQIFVSETSPVVFSVNPNDTDINKGTLGITLFSADFTLVTGGWEAENWNFSLLDFFSFSASFGLQLPNKDNLKFVNSSFEMAIWKPSFSFELFDKEISLTAFVGGSAGGFELTENYQAVGLGIFKIGIDNKQGE